MDGTAGGHEIKYLRWRIQELESELGHANQLNSGLQQKLAFTKKLFRNWQYELNRATGRRSLENRERKDWIEALQQSEERYRTLYNQSPVMAWSTDPEGRLVSASNNLLQGLGYGRAELIGLNPEELLSETSRNSQADKLNPRTGTPGLTSDIALQLLRKDGQLRDILLSVLIEQAPDGRPLGSMATMVDVTARNQAEQALRHYAGQLSDILGSIPEIIRLRDRQHRVLFTNHEPQREPDDIPCYQSQGRPSPCPDCPASKTLATGEIGRIERQLPGAENRQEILTYPISDETGAITHIVEHIRDLRQATRD